MAARDSETLRNHTKRVFDGREVSFDEEGFFLNPESWTEAIAETIASEMGIEKLNDGQWKMIYFLRGFYLANGRAPLNRDIRRETGLSLLAIERLFPGGIRGGARRLAGLPNPRSC